MRDLAIRVRDSLLPRGASVRRVPFGLVAGIAADIECKVDSSFYFGWYETPLNRHFRAMVRRGDRCFDIGAYRGWHALVLAKLSGCPVVTVDTNPATAGVIRRNAELNGYDIRLIHAYVGDGRPGTLSLDAMAREHFVPDFIKMDIEGAEDSALEGASTVLSSRGPGLIIEVHGAEKERRCIEILRSHGYEPRIVDEPRWKKAIERRSAEVNRWLVCAGRPRSGPA